MIIGKKLMITINLMGQNDGIVSNNFKNILKRILNKMYGRVVNECLWFESLNSVRYLLKLL